MENFRRPSNSQFMTFLLFAMLVGTAEAFTANDPALLQKLLDENRSAREIVKAYSATYSWKVASPPEMAIPFLHVPAHGENDTALINITASGSYRTGTVTRPSRLSDSRGTGHEADSMEVLLNDAYLGICQFSPSGRPKCEQFDVSSAQHLPAGIRERVPEAFWLDLTRYGFGAGDESLQEAVLAHPEVIRWSVARDATPEHPGRYTIQRLIPGTGSTIQSRTEYCLDADKGFMITRVRDYDLNGKPWFCLDVTPREVQPGLWFPEKIVELRAGFRTEITVHSTALNPPIASTQFEWGSISADLSDVVCIRTRLNGDTRRCIFANGKFIEPTLAVN